MVVAEGWRAEVLVGELARAGADPATSPAEEGSTAVRTGWLVALRPVADAWSRGAVKMPPPRWTLDGGRLRWWCIAAGGSGPLGYTLMLGPHDAPAWPAVGAALAGAGVPGVLLGPRGGGPAYRVVGRRRLARLHELVGDRPAGAPESSWPAAGYARGG